MIWRMMWPILLAALVFLIIQGALWVWGPTSAGERVTLVHDQETRSYLLHVPDDVGPNASLVLVLHGGGDFAKRIAEATHWSNLADEEGFIVAYPEGTARPMPRWREAWNAGHCCFHATKENVDDVGFLNAVIQDIRATHSVGAVHMAGFSNGGMMSFRFAVEAPGIVTSVGSVAASLWSGPSNDTTWWSPPADAAPVPVIHFHGKDDKVVPYEGGVSNRLPDWHWASVDDTTGYWAERWNATAGAEQHVSPSVVRTAWSADGQERVVLYAHDAGHSWPGSKMPWFMRDPDQSIDATRLMWDFFRAAE